MTLKEERDYYKKALDNIKRYVNGKIKYYSTIINDPNFIHDETGHWDTGNHTAYKNVAAEIQRFELDSKIKLNVPSEVFTHKIIVKAKKAPLEPYVCPVCDEISYRCTCNDRRYLT